MSVPGPIATASLSDRPATVLRPWLAPTAWGALLAIGIFAAPAVPGRLDDWPALRAVMFFQGLGTGHPAAPGDGPLAILLAPMFGPGNALGHVAWELAAAVFLALVTVLALREAGQARRLGGAVLLLVGAVMLREAAWWIAAALCAPMLWSGRRPGEKFAAGVALGLFGLLACRFWLWGAAVLLFSGLPPGRGNRDTAAAFTGWIGATLAGWTVAHGGPAEFWQFLSGGLVDLGSAPLWQLVVAALLAGTALLPRVRTGGQAALLATGAFALGAVPLQADTARAVAANLEDAFSARTRAWFILFHPERFGNRVLQPAWRGLGASAALPEFADQLGAGPVDVLGPEQLVAVANTLNHVPGSYRTDARAVIAPADLDVRAVLRPGKFHRLMVEGGFALYVHDVPARTGFSPWSLATVARLAHTPSLIESSARPDAGVREGRRVADFHLPARLVFGPAPFASRQLVAKYYWEGGAGRILVTWRQPDGSHRLLMERGLNPAMLPTDRAVQTFVLDLPDSDAGWIDVEATREDAGDASGVLRLVDLEFKRDPSRMMSTTLTPEVLHNGAGYNAMPATIFSATEASPGRAAADHPALLVHMPAAMAFAKPREAVRLTGTFGFLPGAYEKPDGGTAGAVFNIMWFSGNDGATQIFSRTLRPRTEAADRGPQAFDVDLSTLPDGVLSFSITPAVAGDVSWGWTYLGEIDIRRADERPDAERFGETMDAYRAGLRPLPGLLKTNEQKPRLIDVGGEQLLRVHAPGEAIFGVTAGHTKAAGKFGFADEAWKTRRQTDGADFVVLWRDHHGDVELFRQRLRPDTEPADRGVHTFTVNLAGRGNGLLVLRTEAGPANNNYWDWTGWSDLTVW